jgi:hypothetical protein
MGISVARRLGREGYRVALVARRREPLNKLVAELAPDGIEAAAFTVNLRRTKDIPALSRRSGPGSSGSTLWSTRRSARPPLSPSPLAPPR